ncbi:MAG: 2-C-methyl-D-erythritol 4-phosphate cytidylyltransferase [Acidothermus sp.]|nr:2-C-methyl-D-erythritol 4-phosphate cytidylyltransferase [Acidothermus sp.]MCL6538140.1 2-C-methyl-D-erythritol 4-phosphate cytidylyltransferase [Acidothermus sp.]
MLSQKPSAVAVVLAGGNGSRFGAAQNKVYLPLAGRRVISWSVESLARVPNVTGIVVAVRRDERAFAAAVLEREVPDAPVLLVDGGQSRHESEYNAFRAIEERGINADVLVVHDGARPLISPDLVSRLIGVAYAVGGAIPALPAPDVVALGEEGLIEPVMDDAPVARVQTPQVFRTGAVLTAYHAAAREGFIGTDTASCVEHFTDTVVQTIPGDDRNIKVTYPQDLFTAERVLAVTHYVMR